MKKQTSSILNPTVLAALSAFLILAGTGSAQVGNVGSQATAQTAGNAWEAGQSVVLDFKVVSPITVSQLGVFDDGVNGISGSAVLTVQLYSRAINAGAQDVTSGTLLETLSFDAANSGKLIGSGRFKDLEAPVTLLPGVYSIVAYGFDETNRWAVGGKAPHTRGLAAGLNNGGGRIQFESAHRAKAGTGHFVADGGNISPDQLLAGTFIFSPATVPPPSYAADYAALTTGVTDFYFANRRRVGSIALFHRNAFPVIMEPSGNRLILEAASTYEEDPNAARCVVFSHTQWAYAAGELDTRVPLFDNAIRWAARKSNRESIVIGLAPLSSTNAGSSPGYYAGKGYIVKTFNARLGETGETLPDCDVLLVDGHAGLDASALRQIKDATARGVGLVLSASPWLLVHGEIQPAFGELNELLQPFGMAYRPSTTIVWDMGFTHLQAEPYPEYYNAFSAAELLGADKQGLVKLDSLQKMLSLQTLNYALNARPDLLPDISALSSGDTNKASGPAGQVTGLKDVVVLKGAQATANRLGQWVVDGDDLLSIDRRGSVEYEFTLPSGNVHRVVVEGTEDDTLSRSKGFKLQLSVDDTSLGAYTMEAGLGKQGTVECWTPYLAAGKHRLRVFWDNAASYTSLRVNRVLVQKPSSVSGGRLHDWTSQFVRSRSGLDSTKEVMTSYVSPFCLEGPDPFPTLMQMHAKGVGVGGIEARPAPGGRWYANVPLSADQHTPLMLHLSFQNEGISEWRSFQWLPLNLLTASDMTIRQDDSLLLTAQPEGGGNGEVVLGIGTDRLATTGNNPLSYKFKSPGTYTVTGTYGGSQTRSIQVKVVGHAFPVDPACWVGVKRDWDLPEVGADVALESDSRMIFAEASQLPGGGRRVGVIADKNEPRYVVSRLGSGGPILDAARLDDFDFWHGSDTYVREVKTYEDGSQLVELLLVLSPVPADVTVKVELIVGGVLFEDGTTIRELTRGDFDNKGECRLTFVRPATAQTSVCHTIKLLQGKALVGSVQ